MIERPQEQVREVRTSCSRCGQPVTLDDWNGYIVGRKYGFSHCGLVQIAKAVK